MVPDPAQVTQGRAGQEASNKGCNLIWIQNVTPPRTPQNKTFVQLIPNMGIFRKIHIMKRYPRIATSTATTTPNNAKR